MTNNNNTTEAIKVTAKQMTALISIVESHKFIGHASCGGDKPTATVKGLAKKGLAHFIRGGKHNFATPTDAGRELALAEIKRRFDATGDNQLRITYHALTGEYL